MAMKAEEYLERRSRKVGELQAHMSGLQPESQAPTGEAAHFTMHGQKYKRVCCKL